MSRTIGATVEEEAAEVLVALLQRQGYKTLEVRENFDLPADGTAEIDVAARARGPEGVVTFLVEAKARLGSGEVRRLGRLLDPAGRRRLEEVGLPGPWLVYAFGLRIAESAMETALASGIGVLRPTGEVVVPRSVA